MQCAIRLAIVKFAAEMLKNAAYWSDGTAVKIDATSEFSGWPDSLRSRIMRPV